MEQECWKKYRSQGGEKDLKTGKLIQKFVSILIIPCVDRYRAVLVQYHCEINITAILFTKENSAVPEEERKEGEICGELKSCLT